MITRCHCGEEVGFGSLATPEEIARGLCSRCEAGAPPVADAALVALCRSVVKARTACRWDDAWLLAAQARRYPEDEIRRACREIGVETI